RGCCRTLAVDGARCNKTRCRRLGACKSSTPAIGPTADAAVAGPRSRRRSVVAGLAADPERLAPGRARLAARQPRAKEGPARIHDTPLVPGHESLPASEAAARVVSPAGLTPNLRVTVSMSAVCDTHHPALPSKVSVSRTDRPNRDRSFRSVPTRSVTAVQP